MSNPNYRLTIEDALLAVSAAKKEAVGMLDVQITKQHYIAAWHYPHPWESVAKWYYKQDGYNELTMRIIDDISTLSTCEEYLVGLLKEERQPNLTLPKIRKTA